MKCEHCDHDIANDSVFCEYCGKKISSKSNILKNKRLILSIAGILIIIAVVCAVLPRKNKSVGYRTGTTLSCVSDVRAFDEEFIIKSYFVFKSDNEVMWLVGQNKTDATGLIPIGYGQYDPSSDEISFSASYYTHRTLEVYEGLDSIVFKINRDDKTVTMQTRPAIMDESGYSDVLCFQRDVPLALTKERFKIMLNDNLVGSHWRVVDAEKNTVDVYFTYMNEVSILAGSEQTAWPYIYANGEVSIQCDDDLGVGLVGKYDGGDEMTLYTQCLFDVSERDQTAYVFKKVVE